MEPTEAQVVPSSQRVSTLTAMIGVAGTFNAPTVILYQNAAPLSPRSVIADLNVATFVGYSNTVGMVWEAPYVDVDGTALAFGTAITQVCTSALTPNLLYGYALTAVALAALWAAYQFTSPVNIANPFDGITYLPALRYSGN
jgi:hypothetical protein